MMKRRKREETSHFKIASKILAVVAKTFCYDKITLTKICEK